MQFKQDKSLGYMYCYAPNHPLANKAGKVYEHRYVMWQSIGRMFAEDECVHHIDGDRTNNKLENLMLLTQSEHHALHDKENGYEKTSHSCANCGESFTLKATELLKRKNRNNDARLYCSQSCSKKAQKRFDVSAKELSRLVWTHPTTKVGEMFGVSGKAVENRCKKLGIAKPPRGYWAKQRSKGNK